ncbi:MAG: autotransporter assembly complex protein TamA [Desulfobaccales bacterium]
MPKLVFSQRWLIGFTLVLVFLSLPQAFGSQPAPGPQENLKLHSFKIVGNRIIKTAEIKKELSEKRPSLWTFWKGEPAFRRADLDYDVDRLKIYYRNEGFFHTEITPEVREIGGGKADVTLHIQEGPWVKVIGVDLRVAGNAGLSGLKGPSPLKPGDRFTEQSYSALKTRYLNYLGDHGYPWVKVQGKVVVDEKKNTASISLKVDPGTLSYFGKPHIQDAEKLETPPAAILEKLTFKPGEIFNRSQLFASQRQLYATGLFQSVLLTPEKVPQQESKVPIKIELEEKKKHALKFGLGFGDEDLVRTRLGYTWRNLGGGGRILDLSARYSLLGYRFEENFTNPAIFGSQYDFVHQSGATRLDLPGFSDQAYYTQARLERTLAANLTGYAGYGLEFARPFDIPLQTLILLQGTEPEKMYRASYLQTGLRLTTVDSQTNPTKGELVTLDTQAAPTFLGSGLQFSQAVVEARDYQALTDSGVVLAGRVKCGVIEPMQSTSQIPIDRRFFTGGADSVRGYELDYLGPRNSANDPIGGEAELIASLELRFPLPLYYKNIGGVVFMDAGNVFFKIHDMDLGQLKYSPGFGLRYLSPIGPVGIDIAFPTNRINYEKDSPYQIHFTVGYAF